MLRRRLPRHGLRLPLIAVAAVLVAAASGAVALARSSALAVTVRAVTVPAVTVTAVPQGFVGVDADGPLFGPGTPVDFNNQLGSMVTNGVQSIRVAFSWASGQPYVSWSAVPSSRQQEFTDVAGRPTDFQLTDMIVGDAARRRISVLPTVLYTPTWDAQANSQGLPIPRRTAPYGAYLTALIQRYGPRGSFWRQNPGIPKLPIRMWQIWNEPNLSFYWRQPYAQSYVALLRVAHSAIKHADPGAKVVLGALTNLAWKAIGPIYRINGARNLFDVVSVNGFTKLPANVILYLQLMRNAMDRFQDGKKPLIATELSWPSAKGRTSGGFDFDTTEAGQARDIAALLPMIGRQRVALGLIGFYYYTWISDETPPSQPFNFAGLLRLRNGQVAAKPALAAYRRGVLALEQCRRKGAFATSCVK